MSDERPDDPEDVLEEALGGLDGRDTETDPRSTADAGTSEQTERDPDDARDAVRADGGAVEESPFDVVSQYEETRLDKWRKRYDAYVRAPLAIIWRDWRARIGFSIVFVYLFMGLAGPHLVDQARVAEAPALQQPFETWQFPWDSGGGFEMGAYPLGTDRMGRGLLSQIVHSTPQILKMILAGAFATVGTGTVIGAIAGYKGGNVDTILSSITDVFINIPGFPLVMVLGLMLDDWLLGNPYLIGVLLSVAAWGGLARAVRSQMLTLREESFVEASRSMGIPTRTIVFREIVPHLMPYVVINMSNAGRRIIFEAVALYYLGILPFEDQNWGTMLNSAYSWGAHYRPEALHWFLVPMVAIVFISIGLTLLGQSLDRVFNPRVRARHEKHSGEGDLEPDEEAAPSDGMRGV